MNKIMIVENFKKSNILVIGDMVADIYLKGNISRISREAPVLILEYAGEKIVPGGAANVVNNIATLDGSVLAYGLIGDDISGTKLKNLLEENKINVDGLIVDYNRPTITKTRVVAGGAATVSQQVVRIDKEPKIPIDKKMESKIIKQLSNDIKLVDGIVLSDYGSGMVTNKIKKFIIDYCKENKKFCIVDSRYDILSFKGVSYVKQNEAEAAKVVGFDLLDEESIVRAGKILLEKLQAKGIIISRGEEGMSLFEDNGAIHHIPVIDKSEVFDVSGAGDTAVAAFSLAIASGATPVEATEIANFAAGIAVRKLGTATVSNKELQDVLGEYYADCQKSNK